MDLITSLYNIDKWKHKMKKTTANRTKMPTV